MSAPTTAGPAADRSPQEQAALSEPVGAVRDSMSVAFWTVVSRGTGLVRGVVVATVLGATYLANTYQFTNALPNLVFYGFLAGSLFSSLLVPALVRHLDAGDERSAARVAGGLLGAAVSASALLVPLAVVAAPAALRLAAGADPAAAAGQARVGAFLLLLLLPQVPLYAVVGTATAVMNGRRRFALAAAAPALENLGTIAVLGAAAVLYPGPHALADAPPGLLLLLGLGTTASVGLHAAVQWWGARRVGVVLRPRRGWRDPEVRALVRRAVPSAAQAALSAVQVLVLLVVANRIAGGVVAFQLALSFFFLPVALGATPVALSLSPRLSRLTAPADARHFRDAYLNGMGLALFLTVPAATAYVVLAGPLAAALSFGAFAGAGVPLLAAAVAGLGAGVVGETVFLVSTYACYARGDTRTPLRAMVVQALVALPLAVPALLLTGPAVLTALGAALSAGTVAGALYLCRALVAHLPPGGTRWTPGLLRTAASAAVMVVPAALIAPLVQVVVGGPLAAVWGIAAATVTGAVVYLTLQWALGAPEVAWAAAALRRREPRRPAPSRAVPETGSATRSGTTAWTTAPSELRASLPAALRDGTLLLACAGFGGLLVLSAPLAGLALALAVLVALVWWRPVLAAYLLVVLTPLTAGIDRGALLPAVRPNEALLALLGGVLVARAVLLARTGGRPAPRPSAVDAAVLALCLCASVLPLLVMLARQRAVSGDDLSHALVPWRLAAVYAVVRFTVRQERHARSVLVLSLVSGAVVSALAVLQSVGAFGVPDLLARLYSPFGVESALTTGRGSSTLALPAAVADLAVLNLAISLAFVRRGGRLRGPAAASAVLSVFGILAAGQFSSALGLVVALAAVVVVTRYWRVLRYAVPVVLLAGVLLQSVVVTRLQGFQSASGLPVSWVGRLRNLQTYFWPEVASHWNWLLGVRPAARVPSSTEVYGWIWIESGYTWLLWGGGIPLLLAYAWFVVAAVRTGSRLARTDPGAAGVAGTAVVAAVAAQVVLMLFDPHLTYRGAGDALFAVLALVAGARLQDGRPG